MLVLTNMESYDRGRRIAKYILVRAAMVLALMLLTTTAWAGSQPVGDVEITGGPMSVYVKGWAYDPDNEAAAVNVRVEIYNDENCTEAATLYSDNVLTANQATTGIEALNSITGNHGFEGYITTGGDNKWVMVYAVDGTDGDAQLGSKTQVLIKILSVSRTPLVTPDNMDDILENNDGTHYVTFDNATNTLTLNFPNGYDGLFLADELSPNSNNGTIITANFDLTISGNWCITSDCIDWWTQNNYYARQAINCSGSLTFDGDFILLPSRNTGSLPEGLPIYAPVVYAGGDITLSNGSLVVGSIMEDCPLRAGGTLNVGSGFTRLEVKGYGYTDENDYSNYKKYAIKAQSLTLGDGISIIQPFGGTFDSDEKTIVNPDGSTHAQHIIIASETGAAQPAVLSNWNLELVESGKYDLWLGDTQVTYANRNDILGDGGSATFDVDNDILTLNNPTISGSHNGAKIYVGTYGLTIAGSYHMTEAETYYGLCLWFNSATLDGNFTFSGTGYGIGILSIYDLTVKSGSLTATGSVNGISCGGNLIVQDGTDIVDMTSNYNSSVSALVAKGLTLAGNYAITTPDGGIFKNKEIYQANGTTKAQHAIISRSSTVTFAKDGYGTYYDGTYDVKIPTGMKARIVTAKGDGGTLSYETVADGDKTDIATATVPAGTAVLLQTAAGDATHSIDIALYRATDTRDFTTASGNDGGYVNMLFGSDAAGETTGDGKHYKLSYGEAGGEHENVLGWYWGAADGAAFTSAAHKAWLVLPASSLAPTRGYFGLPGNNGETTEIRSIANGQLTINKEDSPWYTIDGRKLQDRPTKSGLYIHNGKKEVLR